MNVDRLSSLPGNAVTVRGLTPELKARLRVRAAHNARSMEAEARAILEAALSAPDDDSTDLGAFARGLFAPLGGVELDPPSRAPPRPLPEFVETQAEGGNQELPESAPSASPQPLVKAPPAGPNSAKRRRS